MTALRLVAAILVALALNACSGQPSGSSSGTTSGTGRASASATSEFTVHSGVTTFAPGDAPQEAISPDPNFDYGFVVQITSGGFHPKWLVSGCCKPVTWKNLTDTTVSVVFDHQEVNSGPIAPGGTFVYTPPHPFSITYHSGIGPSMNGAVQVNQEFDS